MKLIFQNSIWLIADKLLKLSVGLFVSIWIVRYLGPEWFGKFNYINAIIVLLGTLITFGSEGILVRMFVSEVEKQEEILSASFSIFLVFGFVSFILSFFVIWILRPTDDLYLLTFLLSLPSLFKCFSVVRYIYEAKLEVRYIVWIENFIFLVISGIRILIIFLNLSFNFLFLTFALEGIITSLSIYYFYNRKKSFSLFQVLNSERVRKILNDSFPLFIAGLAIIVYMKIDQIMIGSMLGDSELGIYSVGVRWSEFWYFIPIGLSSSFFPDLIKLKNESASNYEKRFKLLHVIVFWIAIFGAVGIQFFSETLILFLYGDLFYSSSSILKIHIWSGIFVFLGVAGGNFFLIENLQKYTIWKSLFGLFVNIILNYVWIPKYGITGAAIATLISQFCASTLFLVFFKELRPLLKLQFSVFFVWNINITSLKSIK
ncbi:flippase [Leptospira perdikensis]|uniref:Flippase n=1 Tax=Leptospira perdikensis TaxID=2484948 RepID=A0A4R9JCD1_9LEPT|nr:flippase [Leptospira perdikensis]TGL37122.1 flippase [Leptospira perdikensis]